MARQGKARLGGDWFAKAWLGTAWLELTKLAEQGQELIEDKGSCKEGRGWQS